MDPIVMLILSTGLSVGLVYRFCRNSIFGFLITGFLFLLLMGVCVQVEMDLHEHRPAFGASVFAFAIIFSPVPALLTVLLILRSHRKKLADKHSGGSPPEVRSAE